MTPNPNHHPLDVSDIEPLYKAHFDNQKDPQVDPMLVSSILDAMKLSSRQHNPWRRKRIVALSVIAASIVVIALIAMPEHKTLPQDNEVAMASNAIVDKPKSAITDAPDRITRGGDEDYLIRPGDRFDFHASHPTPRKYQWLIHIANSAKLVASANENEEIRYLFQQLDTNWKRGDSRSELLVLVTADVPPGKWPERVLEPIDLKELFTDDVIEKLQGIGEEPDFKLRGTMWLKELSQVLDHEFGATRYGFQVYPYSSDKK